MSIRIVTLAIRHEHDVVAARQRAREISRFLGFDGQDQVRIATAVSEIARNAFEYAAGGEVAFSIEGRRGPQLLVIEVSDKGPGIADLARILAGQYRSVTGMGVGIVGARRLMDHFAVRSAPGDTSIVMKKVFPEKSPPATLGSVAILTKQLLSDPNATPWDEVRLQNTELMRVLGELRERQEELLALNRELEDTNRGVVSLYGEMDERADALDRANQTKTRFLANVSHEFRTPLNCIRALTRLLLDQSDGPVTAEQQIQITFISNATADLTGLVDDLLDLAKIEAGKVDVRLARIDINLLFSSLRGMFRPLLAGDGVALHFDDAAGLPAIVSDEGKVSQILRNLISNALKFTERGTIRVTAVLDNESGTATFSVADTGIGIPEEDQERIFEEFIQVRSALQARVKGTGLGLPLCRNLARLLQGSIALQSNAGQGSIFSLSLPLRHAVLSDEKPVPEKPFTAVSAPAPLPPGNDMPEPHRLNGRPRPRVLVIDDDPAARYVIRKLCRKHDFQVVEAGGGREGLRIARIVRPDLIVLDLDLPDRRGEEVLKDLAGGEATGAIPVLVATSDPQDPGSRDGLRLGCMAFMQKSELNQPAFDLFLESIGFALSPSMELE